MTATALQDAKPCRWCGGRRFVWVSGEDEAGTPLDKVGCRECGATGPGCDGQAAAIKVWNACRSELPAAPALREALERLVEAAAQVGSLESEHGDYGAFVVTAAEVTEFHAAVDVARDTLDTPSFAAASEPAPSSDYLSNAVGLPRNRFDCPAVRPDIAARLADGEEAMELLEAYFPDEDEPAPPAAQPPGEEGERDPVEDLIDQSCAPPASDDGEGAAQGHSYPGIVDGEFMHTSDCAHGCGCWMGGSRSGGPDGVDPFGACPAAPPAPPAPPAADDRWTLERLTKLGSQVAENNPDPTALSIVALAKVVLQVGGDVCRALEQLEMTLRGGGNHG